MRFLAAIVALCAAGLVILNEYRWRKKDNRHLSFRAVVISVLILLGLSVAAQARPSPYPGVTQFNGDRYDARAQLGPEVARSVKRQRAGKARYLYPTRKRAPAKRQRWQQVPIWAPLAEPGSVEPLQREENVAPAPLASEGWHAPGSRLSVAGGVWREAKATVIGGRPAGCPHRFCGCGASLHLFGRIIPALNLAANWLRFPRAAPGPDMVAARRGHVFVLKRHIAGNTWLVFDANSGRGRTRIHPRSIAGYQIVNPRGGSS